MKFEYIRERLKKYKFTETISRFFYIRVVDLIERDRRSRELVYPYSSLENDKQIIFVHIPKNAGNGIAKSLFDCEPKGHNALWQYQIADPEKYSKFYKFCFVRNPWDRFYSAYEYLKKGGFGVYDKEFYYKYLSKHDDFRSFVLSLKDEEVAKKIMSWTHFLPQSYFVKNQDGKLDFDFIGRVENIDEDLKVLSKQLKLDEVHNIKSNSSNKASYIDIYDQKMIAIIASLYAEDLELFLYEW